MIDLAPHPQGTVVPVRAQPGARCTGVVGEHAGALRVAVSAPPEKGKANAAIGALLARALGCKASRVALLTGAASRRKTFLVAGVAPGDLRARIDALLADGGTAPTD